MAQVFPGRYTAEVESPLVVFIIGMRINRMLAFRKWIPTALAMGPMLRTLYEHQAEKGFLGARTFVTWRGVTLIQYWRSFEDLERFARSKDEPHLKAWRRFNQAVGGDGSVGIYHETYQVQPGQVEAVYGNMPVYGLAAATRHVRVAGRRETARGRMTGMMDATPEDARPAPTAAVTK